MEDSTDYSRQKKEIGLEMICDSEGRMVVHITERLVEGSSTPPVHM